MTDTTEPSHKVVVYHSGYGCDTGCCGHVVELDGQETFDFSHPYGAPTEEAKLAWAKEFVREHLGEQHVADLDWENCLILDD